MDALLNIRDLRVTFPVSEGFRRVGEVQALRGVSLRLNKGRVLGIVGESGCGKSTLARAVMGLVPVAGGRILLDQRDLSAAGERPPRAWRRDYQMIFQDPEASLNPRFTCGELIGEPLKIFEPDLSADERITRVRSLMEEVGLHPRMIRRFPHEFSGGQRQRICIARAISTSPALLICDEAVSALDVSVQAQILNLLMDVQESYGLSYVFISHDLSVVRHISDDILVMYLGCVMESGPAEELIRRPVHPYTRALLAAVPRFGRPPAAALEGEIPSPLDPPPGCPFAGRCPSADATCREQMPPLTEREGGRQVACFHK